MNIRGAVGERGLAHTTTQAGHTADGARQPATLGMAVTAAAVERVGAVFAE